jgi:tripartite-type tricarboxylate transporter receptor subunit TctC
VTAYGVTSSKRLAVFPNLPTLSEAGLRQFEFTVWHGLYAPPATPPAVIEKLNQALQTGLSSPVARKRFEDAGRVEFATDQRSPDAHRQMLAFESQRLSSALGQAGLMATKTTAR